MDNMICKHQNPIHFSYCGRGVLIGLEKRLLTFESMDMDQNKNIFCSY